MKSRTVRATISLVLFNIGERQANCHVYNYAFVTNMGTGLSKVVQTLLQKSVKQNR